MNYRLSAALAAILIGAGSAAQAETNPMLDQLAGVGGAAEAAGELCQVEADFAGAKRQQEAYFLQMGGTREQFVSGYQAGYDRTKAEYQAASAEERNQMCNDFRRLQTQ